MCEQTKQCGKCGENKPVEAFAKRTRSKDGRQAYCKVCNSKNSKKFRKENPDYHNEYYKNNPEYFREYYKQRRQAA